MHTIVETRLLEAAAELRAIAEGQRPAVSACGCEEPPARPLAQPLDHYLHAASNQGPLAQCWRSTPEVLLCDLVAAVRYYRDAEAHQLAQGYIQSLNTPPAAPQPAQPSAFGALLDAAGKLVITAMIVGAVAFIYGPVNVEAASLSATINALDLDDDDDHHAEAPEAPRADTSRG